MAGGAEDAVECIGGSGGAKGKAKAGNAVRAEFLERLRDVGFRVAAFVAIVIRKTIGQDDQQPIRRAGLALEDFACTTDAGAQSRIARWLELIEPCSPYGAETLPERFDRRQMDCVSALRPERVDRDAVAKLFECDGQCGGRAPLVVMYGETVRIGVSRGSGRIEQDEDAEVASSFAALQVDVFGR